MEDWKFTSMEIGQCDEGLEICSVEIAYICNALECIKNHTLI